MKVTVITVSDRASRGIYQDLSGPSIVNQLLKAFPDASIDLVLVSDSKKEIQKAFSKAFKLKNEVVLTTGGTGFAPRDLTPEVTLAYCDRLASGISEYLRYRSLSQTNQALLSRAVAGLKKEMLIINLPGSVNAATFCIQELIPLLPHAIKMAKGDSH